MKLSRLTSAFVASLAFASSVLADAPAALSPKGFPFQEQAFRVRFQPNFFKVGSDLFEDILKSSGVVDDTKILHMKDKLGHPNYVHYNSLKTSLRMEDGRLIAAVKIGIVDGELFSKEIEGCSVLISGQLGFAATMDFGSDGKMSVDAPAQYFDGSGLQMEKKDCGFLADLFAGPEYIHKMINDGIKENLSQIIASQDFKMVTKPDVDATLRKARVFLNLPSSTALSTTTKSNFGMAVGIHGSLAGVKGAGNCLRVVNSKTSPYLAGLGLEWALDTGFQALTQNIYDVDFKEATPVVSHNWPEWGKAAYAQTGSKVDFDAAVMLRATFLKSLFTNLYRAGFFNLQLQDSLLDKKLFSLNPTSWKELLDITLPNGQPLNAGNFRDMRIETNMGTAPDVTIRDSKSLDLTIPDLTMKLSVQSKDSAMFEVLAFRARFHIVTVPQLDEDGQLALSFNEQPVESFELISRSGVGKSISDDDIKNRLNQTIVAILKKAKVEIPLMKNRKITIPYMGIDGDKANGSEALAVYLKVK